MTREGAASGGALQLREKEENESRPEKLLW